KKRSWSLTHWRRIRHLTGLLGIATSIIGIGNNIPAPKEPTASAVVQTADDTGVQSISGNTSSILLGASTLMLIFSLGLTLPHCVASLKEATSKRFLKRGHLYLSNNQAKKLSTEAYQKKLEETTQKIAQQCTQMAEYRKKAMDRFPEIQAITHQKQYTVPVLSQDIQKLFEAQVHLEFVPDINNQIVDSLEYYQAVEKKIQKALETQQYLPELELLDRFLPTAESRFFDEKRTFYGSGHPNDPATLHQIELEVKHIEGKIAECQLKLCNALIASLPAEERFDSAQKQYTQLKQQASANNTGDGLYSTKLELLLNALNHLEDIQVRDTRRIQIFRQLIDTYLSQRTSLQGIQQKVKLAHQISAENNLPMGQDPELLEKLLAAESDNPILKTLNEELRVLEEVQKVLKSDNSGPLQIAKTEEKELPAVSMVASS
ncbi:MAG: hypothetical protein K2X66_07295, partial [Cyanobacteria bacterium]|nr:hypothetical protein [Cyanobacteriota bacterium]